MEKYVIKTKEDGTEITVRDVQLVLLEMLKDIDEICRKHHGIENLKKSRGRIALIVR